MTFFPALSNVNVRLSAAVPLVVLAAGLANPAWAAPNNYTPAGTVISNTATATYTDAANAVVNVPSNTVTLRVDELLDVKVAAADAGDVPAAPGSTNQILAFTVTNTGNGPEAFQLTPVNAIGGDAFDPTTTSIVIDTNNNGVYDAGVDTVYSGSTAALAPDTSLRVFVLSTVPAGATDGQRGQTDLKAAAVTGTGAAGTTFAGAAQGGGDAVVGASTGQSQDKGFYVVSAATVSFVKSATVLDPFGGSKNLPGSIITYTLVATVGGSGSLANLAIADPVPAGTTYQAGSITLQGAAVTDAIGDDAGEISSNSVAVRFGTVPGGQTRTVTFKAKIN